MTIEFHTNFGMVSENIISGIRNNIIELSHFSKNISRAEVFLKEDISIISVENKICEIRLTILGDNFFAHSRTDNFKDSAKEALKDLKRMVKHQVKKINESQHIHSVV